MSTEMPPDQPRHSFRHPQASSAAAMVSMTGGVPAPPSSQPALRRASSTMRSYMRRRVQVHGRRAARSISSVSAPRSQPAATSTQLRSSSRWRTTAASVTTSGSPPANRLVWYAPSSATFRSYTNTCSCQIDAVPEVVSGLRVNLSVPVAVCMGMRNALRLQAPRPDVARHRLHCTCSPIRWSSPVIDEADPADLPCLALAANPESAARKPEPRRNRQVTTWEWGRTGGRTQHRPTAA